MFIAIARMHHIRSRSKFRRLLQCAESAHVSGLAKSGRPGVLLFQSNSMESINTFLHGVRSLRYLDFHHVATRPLSNPDASVFTGTKPGLREVNEMKELLQVLEVIGADFKQWFRSELGMGGPPGL
ncbi:hypothetical protein MKEN_00322800 [Mycena kentingensis (nom. inval.)]|nr:hypothetical protein MKEN_00322800 [Mycena kentingensis (nom. inval.)]